MASLKPRGSDGKILITKMTKKFFLKNISESRRSCGESVQNFKFNKSRCRLITSHENIKPDSNGVIYWMSRDCRLEDNWAVLFAQRLALKHKIPVFIIFNFYESEHLYPSNRQFKFLLKGLQIIEKECKTYNIQFYAIKCKPIEMVEIVKQNNIGAVVCDFNPLREPQGWQKTLADNLPKEVPLVQVDAHNIVPAWIASNKQEFMAKTIRPKINALLPEYMTGFPCICKQEVSSKLDLLDFDFKQINNVYDKYSPRYEVAEIESLNAGSNAGLEMLHSFMSERLKCYGIDSNDPSKNAVSNMSFWIHFGHISSQRIAIEVESLKSLYKDQVEKYLEELIIRKELSDNYCFYNQNYDNITGAPKWAQETLKLHKKDKRPWVYVLKQFENASSHDDIWNAAQLQLQQEGKIHGYLRMYWCKKILEWSESPEKALEYAIWLNDTFALDGTDPNGYVGIMWSICGLHDQGWKERNIFGKVRYMVDTSLKRKFDMASYCSRYGKNLQSPIKTGLKRKKHDK